MSKVPIFDWQTGEFVRTASGAVATAEGLLAVEQVVLKAQQTPRGVHLIYASDDPATNHKFGSDVSAALAAPNITEEVRVSELKRAVSEAVVYDPFVTQVNDVQVTKEADGYTVSFSVESIFGTISVEGVKISDKAAF